MSRDYVNGTLRLGGEIKKKSMDQLLEILQYEGHLEAYPETKEGKADLKKDLKKGKILVSDLEDGELAEDVVTFLKTFKISYTLWNRGNGCGVYNNIVYWTPDSNREEDALCRTASDDGYEVTYSDGVRDHVGKIEALMNAGDVINKKELAQLIKRFKFDILEPIPTLPKLKITKEE